MRRLFLAAASMAALSTAAHALTNGTIFECDLAKPNNGDLLEYRFQFDNGVMTELFMKKNHVLQDDHKFHVWRVSDDDALQGSTLRYDDDPTYAIAYPWPGNNNRAALYHNNQSLADGSCFVQSRRFEQSPPVTTATESPPAYSAPVPSYSAPVSATGEDSVRIISNGRKAMTWVTLGSRKVLLLIDTGATHMLVSPTVAGRLLAASQADEGRSVDVRLGNGRVVNERSILIHRVQVGRHVLSDVLATVAPDDGSLTGFGDGLLPFTILNQIGRFTIDTANGKLVFG
jgi:predicted aspartyl protease